MADYVCIIQAGQAASQKQPALAEGLKRIGREAFGDDPARTEISWRIVSRGFGWTAAEPSRASLIIRSVPMGCRSKSARPSCTKSATCGKA